MLRSHKAAIAAMVASLALAVGACAVEGPGQAGQDAPSVHLTSSPHGHGVAVVRDLCSAEDSCSLNYRANGTWAIRQQTP